MKSQPLSIAVLMGGHSREAEVSRSSAREVAAGLRSCGHRVACVELDQDIVHALTTLQPDVVFPALHGPPGEDGTVQGFLEIFELPYVGSDVHGSATAMDKSLAKAVYRRAGLPVMDDLLIRDYDDAKRLSAEIRAALGDAVVIKPLSQGSAIGVSRVRNPDELPAAIETAAAFGGALLVEPFVAGREITVGVLDLDGETPRPFPVIEIRTATNEWYDYDNRYRPGGSEHLIPAPLPASVNAQLQQIALEAHSSLGLRDLSRSDFIVDEDNGIYLLETNTMPGMTPTSLYPDGARAAGIEFDQLVDQFVTSALRRAGR